MQKALKKAGWSVDDVDLFELNEAFAAQAVAVQQELAVPDEKVRFRSFVSLFLFLLCSFSLWKFHTRM